MLGLNTMAVSDAGIGPAPVGGGKFKSVLLVDNSGDTASSDPGVSVAAAKPSLGMPTSPSVGTVINWLSNWLKSDAEPSLPPLFLSGKELFSVVGAEELKLSRRFKAMVFASMGHAKRANAGERSGNNLPLSPVQTC
jgi:hypothetical protein